jgi:hypothetical protein
MTLSRRRETRAGVPDPRLENAQCETAGDTAPVTRGRFLAAVLAAVCVAGCGDEGSERTPVVPPAPLTAQERRGEDRAVAEIRAYCRGLARSLATGRDRPSQAAAITAARRIAALAERKPEATYRGSQTARTLAADLAEDLEGTNCSQLLVAELARGL